MDIVTIIQALAILKARTHFMAQKSICNRSIAICNINQVVAVFGSIFGLILLLIIRRLKSTCSTQDSYSVSQHCILLHITDALASLHWLRVPERILFKVAVLSYQAVNGSAPAYLSSYFTRVADVPSRLRLRSSHCNGQVGI